MPERAIWRGTIVAGKIKLPVRMFSAVEDREVHFHLLHKTDKVRVRQKMVHPETGREVPLDEVQRGYEIEPGTFVILEPQDLAAIEPDSSREITISHFVPRDAINHQWYERPYWLGPDSKESIAAHYALAEILEKQNREGVAHWVMRKRTYHGALRSESGQLMLVSLRSASEVVSLEEMPRAEGRELDAKELSMAEQLVSSLEGDFDPARFHDEYRERVMEMIEAKSEGRKPKVKKFRRKPQERPLADLLQASLRRAREKAS